LLDASFDDFDVIRQTESPTEFFNTIGAKLTLTARSYAHLQGGRRLDFTNLLLAPVAAIISVLVVIATVWTRARFEEPLSWGAKSYKE